MLRCLLRCSRCARCACLLLVWTASCPRGRWAACHCVWAGHRPRISGSPPPGSLTSLFLGDMIQEVTRPQPCRFGTAWEMGRRQLCRAGQAGPGQVPRHLHFEAEGPSADSAAPTLHDSGLECEASVDNGAKAWATCVSPSLTCGPGGGPAGYPPSPSHPLVSDKSPSTFALQGGAAPGPRCRFLLCLIVLTGCHPPVSCHSGHAPVSPVTTQTVPQAPQASGTRCSGTSVPRPC